jgi:hypothetical protein
VFEKHSKHEYHTLSLLKNKHFLKSFLSEKPSIIDILDMEILHIDYDIVLKKVNPLHSKEHFSVSRYCI